MLLGVYMYKVLCMVYAVGCLCMMLYVYACMVLRACDDDDDGVCVCV